MRSLGSLAAHLVHSLCVQLLLFVAVTVLMPVRVMGVPLDALGRKLLAELDVVARSLDSADPILFLLEIQLVDWAVLSVLGGAMGWIVWSQRQWSLRMRIAVATVVLLGADVYWISVAQIWDPSMFVFHLEPITRVVPEGFFFFPHVLVLIAFYILTCAWLAGRLQGPKGVIAFALNVLVVSAPSVLQHTLPEDYDVRLPPRSVVVLMADSWRSDYFNGSHTPALWGQHKRLGATWIRTVVPPVERTSPAMVSLLTGKQPFVSGVTHMFSPVHTTMQTDSVVSAYRRAGYCTVAAGHYAGDFLQKYDLGFEFVAAPLSNTSVRFVKRRVLLRDALLVATLNMSVFRGLVSTSLRELYEGVYTWADPGHLVTMLREKAQDCGDRPVFAVVLTNQPHFPYPLTWPGYASVPLPDRRPSVAFAFSKRDTMSRREIATLRAIYAASLRSFDAFAGEFVQANHRDSSIVVTSDHGQYLGEGGVFLHGVELGPLDAGAVPALVFGRGRELFAPLVDQPVASCRLANYFARLNNVDFRRRPHWPQGVLYRETGIWFFHRPSPHFPRVGYPTIANGLLVEDSKGRLFVDRRYAPAVEYAKQRQWLIEGATYEVLMLSRGKYRLTRDQRPIDWCSLPALIVEHFHHFHPRIVKQVGNKMCEGVPARPL